ncbi:MAG: PP2C family protein-serine/threonine phosphatase [Planctomycetota bacterium]|jgi:serine phosphatase RsbU (regulator of sigma subunit)
MGNTSTGRKSHDEPTSLELICSEVWGGNRFVETAVRLPGMTGWIYSRPCEGQRGGDVHYLSTCSAGLLSRVCLADVVGHGEQVAQMSGWIHGLLKKHMSNPDPQRVLSALNRKAADAGFAALTTAALVSYSAPDGALRYGYAGHPRALLYRAGADHWTPLALADDAGADGAAVADNAPANMPLGVQADVAFDVGVSTLEPGDRLVVYSDGVPETPGADGRAFSDDRVLQALNHSRQRPADEIGPALVAALHEFAGTRSLTHDDVTLIVLDVGQRRTGSHFLHMVRNQMRRLFRPTAH